MPISAPVLLTDNPWRRRHVLLALVTLASGPMAACGGGSGDGGGSGGHYMKARINGQTVEYRQFAVASLYAHQGKADGLLVAGAVQGSQTYPSMSIQIVDPSGLKEGTYRESEWGPSFRYSPRSDEHYISGAGAEMDFTLTIVEMSGGAMRGTFKGTIHDEASDGRKVTWAVTDGEFKLEIRRP